MIADSDRTAAQFSVPLQFQRFCDGFYSFNQSPIGFKIIQFLIGNDSFHMFFRIFFIFYFRGKTQTQSTHIFRKLRGACRSCELVFPRIKTKRIYVRTRLCKIGNTLSLRRSVNTIFKMRGDACGKIRNRIICFPNQSNAIF